MVGDCTGHSDDKRAEFKIFSEIRIKLKLLLWSSEEQALSYSGRYLGEGP